MRAQGIGKMLTAQIVETGFYASDVHKKAKEPLKKITTGAHRTLHGKLLVERQEDENGHESWIGTELNLRPCS
jgi:hypothetical protein